MSRSEDEEGTILVRFYDIKPGKIVRENVIYIGGAVPCPELQVGSKYQYHCQETKSVVPIICVHITHMFDCSDCTEIQKISGAILVVYFIFEHIHHHMRQFCISYFQSALSEF